MAEKFEIGDIVQLKSGGPKMSVDEPELTGGNVRCIWFSGAKRESGTFPPQTLERVSDEEKKK